MSMTVPATDCTKPLTIISDIMAAICSPGAEMRGKYTKVFK